MNTEESIIIYTDGGCTGNPGPGGWACVLLIDGQEHHFSGGEAETTNNRMEMTAVISALEKIQEMGLSPKAQIYTDSQYVKNGLTVWIHGWIRNGWKTASKQPVKNKDLWLRMKGLCDQFELSWHWVKGHSGDKYNELCDSLVEKERLSFQ
ncbi:ribonuclease HI [Oceanispirochaeta crateris]|uniref:Ribonuclease H n=1 Tax=Oceanispirochaeta crateris TaxID=2518645 RepID=A0A5C1QKL4_9SPIO|nr:ribonuclease HI [Oceanispirochaeta crateris]QEN07739.1 ribonuclease HI [Oceanispirochaeta crateris]